MVKRAAHRVFKVCTYQNSEQNLFNFILYFVLSIFTFLNRNLSDGVTDHSSYSHNKKIFHRLRLKDGNIEVKEFKNYKPRKMAFWNKLLPQIRCPEKQCQTSTANGLIPQWNVYSFCFLLMYFAFIHNEILLIFNVQDLKSLL